MSFSRSAYAKSCDGFVPQETDFKRLALVLSSASACKKLAMVSSLKTVFQKMPMAPTFLSSSTTRRHNNARPPPAHTLLSAAAERSSYGYVVGFRVDHASLPPGRGSRCPSPLPSGGRCAPLSAARCSQRGLLVFAATPAGCES